MSETNGRTPRGRWAGSAEEAAADADVLITVLPGPAEVEAALPDQVFAAMAPGAVRIDMTSNAPDAAVPLRTRAGAHGIDVLAQNTVGHACSSGVTVPSSTGAGRCYAR